VFPKRFEVGQALVVSRERSRTVEPSLPDHEESSKFSFADDQGQFTRPDPIGARQSLWRGRPTTLLDQNDSN